MRILVTGAGGFIGSNLVDVFLEAGHRVVAVDRAFDPDLRDEWLGQGGERVALVEGAADDLPPVAVDAAIHAAALTADPQDAGCTVEAHFRANIEPLLAVLEWANERNVSRVVALSSSAVYRATPPGPVDETQPPSPLGLYAVAKQAAENLIETLHTQYGRDVAVVRLSSVYGPRERARATRPRVSLVARLIEDALNTGMMSVYEGEPARDWTYAPDIGRAILALLEAPACRHHLYHVASEQALAPLDIARAIAARLPDVRIEVRSGENPAAPPLARRGYLCSERFRQEFGFDEWTPLAHGIRATIDWQRSREATP